MIKYVAISIGAFLLAWASQNSAARLGYDSYKDTLGALINISSIIFAVIGAWVAIIYPRSIRQTFKGVRHMHSLNNEADSEKDADHLGDLIEIEVVSAFVLMSVLVIQFAFPVLRVMARPDTLLVLKKCGFGVILFLTLLQLYAVIKVITANYLFLNEVRTKNIDAEADKLNR